MLRAVSAVRKSAVCGPRHRVRDSEFAQRQLDHLAVWLDPIDCAAVARHLLWRTVRLEVVLHRAHPERPVRADTSFVQTVVWKVRFGDHERSKLIAVVPQRNAITQAYDGASISAKSD